jgi:MFS transporter, DHA3 family, macrolide efflux protein
MVTDNPQPAPEPSESAAPPPAPAASARGMRTFLLLWFSQFVSGVGTGLGSFALGVWVYRQNASTTQFAMTFLVGTCTALLVGPLAGVLADRWNRKKLILFGDAGAAVMTGLMALALYTGQMRLWHVYIIVLFMVGFSTLQGPAFIATISQLVPRRQLARASGMAQAAGISTGLVSPPLAGALIPVIDYHGVILIDISTFLFAFVVLLFIRLPRPPADAAHHKRRSMLADFLFGWTFIRERSGLLTLLGLFAVTNFSIAIVQVLLTPLILSFGSAADLGSVRSAAAAGGLIGSLALSFWGGPRNRVAGILVFVFLKAPLLLLGALQPSVALIAVATFLYMGLSPFTGGLSQAIWQSKVAHDIQGRVFAMRGLIATATAPLAYLLAGPLADRVFRPLLVAGGPLADTAVGRLLGVGPGRGIGLMFICLGLLNLLAVGIASLSPRLRHVETELPDAPLPTDAPAPAR